MVVRVNIKEHIHRSPPPWWRRLPNRWPFVAWLVAVGAAVFLFLHGGRMGGMTGVAEADRQVLAPLEAARVNAIYFQIGQAVPAGALVVEMDTGVLDAEMTVERLQAERQFAAVMNRAEVALQDALIRQAETLGELEVLDDEVKRLDSLLARQLVDAQTVTRTKARQRALRSAADLYPGLIEGLRAQLADARARWSEINTSLSANSDPDSAPATGTDRLGLLRLRKESYRLYAQEEGIVSDVFHAVGDVVLAGDPIVTIVGRRVKRVVGFLPEASARDVRPGMQAYVSSAAQMGAVTPAHVVAVTPDIVALPGRANPLPQRTLRGRHVILHLDGPHDFFPGESLTIQFERPLLSLLMSPRGDRSTQPAAEDAAVP